MGAIINLEPELYSGIISGVPFVDVLTTMSDPTIPLTTDPQSKMAEPDNESDEERHPRQVQGTNTGIAKIQQIQFTAIHWNLLKK